MASKTRDPGAKRPAGPPYATRALRLGRREYMVVYGLSPAIPLLLHRNEFIRDHASWVLKMEHKYDRRWKWWQLTVPPPISTVAFVNVRPVDVVIGRLLAWWALWRAVRAR